MAIELLLLLLSLLGLSAGGHATTNSGKNVGTGTGG